MAYEFRGFKGLWWEPATYLGWPALLAEAGYTSLMLCYTFAPESGLRWRRPFVADDERAIRRLAAECAARGLELCLAVNPSIGAHAWTPDASTLPFHPTSGRDWFLRYWQARRPNAALRPDPPFRYGDPEDLALLAGKLRRAAEWGVGAFTLSLDDADPGAAPPGFDSVAAAQAWLVAGLREALRSAAPGGRRRSEPPRLRFTPTYYWSEGARAHPEYWPELSARLPEDVDVYWTGERVRTPGDDLTRASAEDAARLFSRRPILWFNYASNDSFRFALQLPPGRPPREDLSGEVAGVLVNPMRQAGLTRLHALAMGEYLRAPSRYDHRAAVERAARRLVGRDAAPWLLRCASVWAAYPDTRTLGADLAREGAPLVERLLDRLTPAYADLLASLASVERIDADQFFDAGGVMTAELRRGAERFRLLLHALRLLRKEHAEGPAAATADRDRLEAELAATDEETAGDARVALG